MHIRRAEFVFVAIAMLIAGWAAGVLTSTPEPGQGQHHQPYTVSDCSEWESTAQPDLPAKTVQNACMSPSGELIVAP
jgi:hypothetical protein